MNRRLILTLRIISLILLDLASYYLAVFLTVSSRSLVGVVFHTAEPFIFSFRYFASIWWIPAIFIFMMAFEKMYLVASPFWTQVKSILKSTSLTILFLLFLISVRNIYGEITLPSLVLLWVYLSLLAPVVRYWGKILLVKTGVFRENVLIFGIGDSAIRTAAGLARDRQLGYKVAAFLSVKGRSPGRLTLGGRRYPVYHGLSRLSAAVNTHGITTVILALPGLDQNRMSVLTNQVIKRVRNVLIVPDILVFSQINSELHFLFMQKVFLLNIRNNLRSPVNRVLKRTFDIVLSVLILPFLLPVIAVIAVMIRMDSQGPAFIVQERLGRRNTIFRCIKFRTMFQNSDEILRKHLNQNPVARKEWKKFKKLRAADPRVTKIGRILRKFSLDEFPQIFNVLKGEMSLIGPRPYLPRERNEIGQFTDIILLTTPGVTGLWQISGRNELSFEERIKLDTWYVQNWSLWLDFIILFRTAEILVTRKGAY